MYEYSELVLFIRPRTQTAALRWQSGFFRFGVGLATIRCTVDRL